MRVVVTGGSGFIGAATCKALANAGHQALVFDRSQGHDIMTDELPDADHVIHLAGMLGTDELFDTPDLAVDVNIKGTLNVLRWCAKRAAGYTGILMPPVFPSVYTATKLCAEHLAKAWHHTHGVPVSHVRAFNVFGPGQKHGPGHPRKIIPAFATEAYAGVPLTVWGDGEQTVDLVYVNDAGQVLVAAVSYGSCEVFDAGTGKAFTVNKVARMVCGIVGVDPLIQYRPMRRGEIPTRIAATFDEPGLVGRLAHRPYFRHEDLVETVQSYKP